MTIALIRMVSSQSVEVNLRNAEDLIDEAASAADYVFLPENFAALASDDPRRIGLAEITADGPIRSFLREVTQRHRCWLFAGTFPIASRPDDGPVPDGRVRAASLVLNPDGSEVYRYDKIHMFDVAVDDNQGAYRESALFEPGEDIVTCECPLGTVGLSVCYDIRFPELYRRLFAKKVDLITVPSAFTETTGQAHFELLMRARAVENSCYMVAACQGGVHDSGRRTWGHSMVVDPWGRVVAELATGPGVLVCEVDLQIRDQLRRDMPFHLQQRLTS